MNKTNMTYNPNSDMTVTKNPNANVVGNPIQGSPILSTWKWDSGMGKLTAEIVTPQGVVVMVSSEAPTLRGQTVQQVELLSCKASRNTTNATDIYDFRIKIIMTGGAEYRTAGLANVTDSEKHRMSTNPNYVSKPVYQKPVNRSKYIKWICEHMIADDNMESCDECKCKHKPR